MKDSKSALILENLPTQNALEILMALKPQELGKILAKMDPKKAAALTELWQKPHEKIKKSQKPYHHAPITPRLKEPMIKDPNTKEPAGYDVHCSVLMLAFLIFVHELGHFTIARICG
ncbi:Uncharacterized conserved protein [Escherichia coli]|nr:Uncharacterized conserved protein [Escherichia coli]